MIVAVASGKGGTGKTTVATNLALSLAGERDVQFLDCDVEEPTAHLFLDPEMDSVERVTIPVPEVDDSRCTYCRRCAEVCAFNALAVLRDRVLVFAELCHGCGACAALCPEGAISEVGREVGVVERGRAGGIEFAHGVLNPGEAISPPVIAALKETMDPHKTVILDAPPGTSCTAVESVKGSHFCLLVTEPTPFGLNDLELAVHMAGKLGIPVGVLINRSDVGDGRVDEFCERERVPVLMRIPWDRRLAELYARGIPVVRELPSWRDRFVDLFRRIAQEVERTQKGG